MREVTATVTSKNQITVPSEVRRALNLTPHDRIRFVLDGNVIRVMRADSVVARTAGVLRRPDQPSFSEEQLGEAIEVAVAEDVVDRSGQR